MNIINYWIKFSLIIKHYLDNLFKSGEEHFATSKITLNRVDNSFYSKKKYKTKLLVS